MDNQRVFLFVALSFVLLLIWQAWEEDYGPKPVPSVINNQSSSSIPEAIVKKTDDDIPNISFNENNSLKEVKNIDSISSDQGQIVRVKTNVLNVEINTIGADIQRVELIKYPVDVEKKDIATVLMNNGSSNFFIAQSGLISKNAKIANHKTPYQTEKLDYFVDEQSQSLKVKFKWSSKQFDVVKTYTFKANDYLVDINYDVINHTAEARQISQYRQLQRSDYSDPNESSFIYTYTGGVIYSPQEKYNKVTFDDIQDKNLKSNIIDGWVAMIQHYFLVALIPDKNQENQYYTKALPGPNYVLGLFSDSVKIEKQNSLQLHSQLYMGPKLQYEIEKITPGLELTVDYGVLTIIAKPLFWLLNKIHSVLGNWGWAIIFLTIFIKLMFYKLSEASYKSMANMRKLQPRMVTLKERFGDDRQKLNQAMMEMYKKEKINPMGGCLPIVVQIPVFIALYWVLLESVELRQATFMLWLDNLSEPDPFYILPLIMGATMLIQQKLNPAPLDPIQAKVMMMLPIMFTVFFAFFPSGLVLYWVVNNMLSIIQQYVITKRIEKQK
ncbi:MAG: membrane protein insertase YidC [Methylococcales bacterium]|jgi:YidC/Oxa1 family membrane protein insertase|nr:membrane protein insertase YidC [Methylococcales bacterium]MBT7411310.1 membrane protein insertase YidC [Methylococcales bacterium]